MPLLSWKKKRTRVLVVCTANVCRSPAAELFLRAHLQGLGLARRVDVQSAGTNVGTPGMAPDPRVVSYAAVKGLKLKGKSSVPVSDALLDDMHAIWVMEESHRTALIDEFPDFTSLIDLFDPAGDNIADPYYRSQLEVEETMDRLEDIAYQRAAELAAQLT